MSCGCAATRLQNYGHKANAGKLESACANIRDQQGAREQYLFQPGKAAHVNCSPAHAPDAPRNSKSRNHLGGRGSNGVGLGASCCQIGGPGRTPPDIGRLNRRGWRRCGCSGNRRGCRSFGPEPCAWKVRACFAQVYWCDSSCLA